MSRSTNEPAAQPEQSRALTSEASHSAPEYTLDQLKVKLNALPQELYDRIYDNVFLAAPAVRNFVTGENILPSPLQVYRAGRDSYAEGYYGDGNIFIFDVESSFVCDGVQCHVLKRLRDWFAVLPPAHADMITRINIVEVKTSAPSAVCKHEFYTGSYIYPWVVKLAIFHPGFPPNSDCVRMWQGPSRFGHAWRRFRVGNGYSRWRQMV